MGSNHPGGSQFGLADGSAKFVSDSVDLLVLQAAAGLDDRVISNLE